jgi:autotransporter translocation and assembly factor TamB
MRRILVLAPLILVIAALASVPFVQARLFRRLEQAVAEALGARVSVAGASSIMSSLVGGSVRVHGLRIVRHGAWRVAAEDVVVDFSPRALFDRRIVVSRIVLRQPRIAVTDRAVDALPRGGGESVPLAIGRIVVDGGRIVLATGAAGTRRLYGADRIDVDVRPQWTSERWQAAVDRLALRPRGVTLPSLRARGSVKGRARGIAGRLDAILADAGRVRVAAKVGLDREPVRYRMAFATDGLATAPFVAGSPVERVRGTVVAHGTAGGRLGYSAALVAVAPRLGDVHLGVDGHARGARHRLQATLAAAGMRGSGDGALDVDAATVDARVRVTGDVAELGRRLDLALRGRATVAAEVRGPLATPRVTGTIEAVAPAYGDARLTRLTAAGAVEIRPDAVRVELARLGAAPPRGSPWSLSAPTTLELGRAIVLGKTTLASSEARVTIGGRLGPGAAVDVALGLEDADLARICRVLDAGECSGTVRATARVTGVGPSPQLDAVVHHSIGADLVATGRVPFPWPSGAALARIPLALDVRSSGFDVAALQPFTRGAVLRLGGRLDLALAVTGSLAAPALAGRLHLSGGQVEPVATRVRYEDVELALSLAPGAIVIDRVAARAGGTLAGRGRVALDGFRPGAIDATVALERLRVVGLPQYEAAASGTLAVTGSPGAPLVAGDVVIDPAVVRPTGVPSGGASVAPDPTIEVVGAAATAVVAPAGPGLAEALALDLRVRIGDDVVVRRADARVDLGGRLEVTKAAGGPLRIQGDARLVRGWATFQERRFTVEPSAIRFDGPPESPTLDITAGTRVGAYDVTVRVSGTPAKPVLGLSSEPPLAESDVLAVLLFGVPTQELGQNQQADLQQRAVGLASAYVAGGLTRSVRDRLGLDVFDVSAGEGTRPGEVRIGRYVTSDIFLSIAQEFGSRVGQAATVEYRLRPRLSVRLSTSTSGSSGIDVLWHRRY